ncbi:hypothetical protein BSKO_11968 [Bryopsis sp. KO-2023]|nr:hypothetical protein BSKO_11968 [Bryopsis sp. KO-2023]
MKVLGAAVLLVVSTVAGSSKTICKNESNCFDSAVFRKLLQKAPRVVGGEDAEEGRFPYMVSLMTSDRTHQCGGVLIDKRWVLTVAHCFGSLSPLSKNPFLLIGALNIRSTEETEGVEEMLGDEVIIHDKYERYDQGYDIALIKLPRDTKTSVRPT